MVCLIDATMYESIIKQGHSHFCSLYQVAVSLRPSASPVPALKPISL